MKKIFLFAICILLAGCQKEEVPLLTFEVAGEEIFLTEEDFLNLPQTERFLSRTNSHGITTEGTFTGVEWSVLADHIGFDVESPATLVASDGFEVMMTSMYLNEDESMFALYQDGEYIRSKDNGRIWFCVGETFTANFWVKYIEKIIIE